MRETCFYLIFIIILYKLILLLYSMYVCIHTVLLIPLLHSSIPQILLLHSNIPPDPFATLYHPPPDPLATLLITCLPLSQLLAPPTVYIYSPA